MKKLFTALLILTGFQHLQATTYYIDFLNGNDANNGTSKITPWKRHPYMRGETVNYTHAAGDRFIFKGGVTWPASQCLPLQAQASGTPSNYDYYGVDVTWYNGASFTKPKFDAQGVEFNSRFCVMFFIPFNALQANIQVDNIDFTGMFWNSSDVRPQGWVSYVSISGSTNITFSNCNFRNWSHSSYSGKNFEDQMFCILGSNQSPYNDGGIITNCVFDGETPLNKTQGQSSCQGALFGWGGKIQNCIIRNTGGGIFTAGAQPGKRAEVSGCTIGPMYISYDPTMHQDAIQDNGGAGMIIYNNIVYDIFTVPIFIGAGWGSGQYDFYNNIVDQRNLAYPPLLLDCQSGNNSHNIYNNTIVAAPGQPMIRANWRSSGGNTINTLNIRNNHYIGEGSLLNIDAGVTISTLVNTPNTQTAYVTATNNGYSRANWYRPTATNSVTVNGGVDLTSYRSGALLTDFSGNTRPQLGAWDNGAHEYLASNNPPPVPLPPATPTNSLPANATTGLALDGFTLSITGYSDPNGLAMKSSIWIIKQGSTVVLTYGNTGTATSITMPPGYLANGTTYTFTVAVINTADVISGFSTPTSFTTTTPTLVGPSTPSITLPTSGATNQPLTLTLASTAYNHPQGIAQLYRSWRLYNGPTAIYNITNGPGGNSISVPTGTLNYYTTYSAEVLDIDANTNSSSPSLRVQFTTMTNSSGPVITNQLPQGMLINFSGQLILNGKFIIGQP